MATINNNDIDKSRKLVLNAIGEKFEEKKSLADSGLLDEAINKKAKRVDNNQPVKSAVLPNNKIGYAEEVKKAIGENKAPISNEALDSALNRRAKKNNNSPQKKATGDSINLEQGRKDVEKCVSEEKAERQNKKTLQPKTEKFIQIENRKVKQSKPIIKSKIKKPQPRPSVANEIKALQKNKPIIKNKVPILPVKENGAVFYIIMVLAALIFYFVFFFFQLSRFS